MTKMIVIFLLSNTFVIVTGRIRSDSVVFGPKGDLNIGFLSVSHFSSDNIESCDELSVFQ